MKLGKKISIKNILLWTKALIINPDASFSNMLNIESISTDSRTIEKGDFFIPVAGDNYDGHDFIDEALKKGAAGFVFEEKHSIDLKKWEKVIKNNLSSQTSGKLIILKSKNNLIFLQDISYNYIREFNPIVIGITGSAGKTTTKDFLVNILDNNFNIKFTPKNFNTEIGIFKSALEIDKDTQFFIAEIGMRAKGQIKTLSENINLDIGAITAIGPSHLEFFENLEEIALAKAEMAEYLCKKSGVIFLNIDDKWVNYIKKMVKCTIIKFGRDNGIDFNFIEKGMDNLGRFSFDFYRKNKRLIEIKLPISGYHNIYNACCAAAICSYLKLKSEYIKESIENTVIERKRMEAFERSDKIIINDCYNASPLSVKKAIDTLKDIALKNDRRSVAILGDMFELGKDSAKFHKDIGQYLSDKDIDVLISFGVLSKNTYEDFKISIKTGNVKDEKYCYYYEDKESLVRDLKNILKPGDVILVKGSRANKMETIVDSI